MIHVLGQQTFDWRSGLERAWYDTVAFLPNFVAFLVILAVGWFVAKAIGSLVDKALERFGFERIVERGGIQLALQRSNTHVSDLLGKLTFYAIFLLALQMAFAVFGPNPVSDLLTRAIAFIPNIIVAMVIVVVAAYIANMVREMASAALGGLSYGRALATAAWAMILAIGVFAALNQVNIAPEIVNGLFYAMLAIIAGSAIVAIGGGGIQPMQQVWYSAMNRVNQEVPKVKDQLEHPPTDQERYRRPA
jgi:hypothetical protein